MRNRPSGGTRCFSPAIRCGHSPAVSTAGPASFGRQIAAANTISENSPASMKPGMNPAA